jgi:uncharacterized membrane protein YfcA
MSAFLAPAAFAIGFSIGLIGIGGIFLLPLLAFGLGLPVETAIGTALVTFACTGVVTTALYVRHGRIDWRLAGWIAIGSLVAGPLGARVGTALPPVAVKLMLAAFLIAMGCITFARPAARPLAPEAQRPGRLIAYGAAVGFGAGLTGVGGPAILVPLLMVVGFPAAAAVAASQPNAIVASFSGALGHALFGHIDWRLAGFIAVFQCAGAVAGSEVGVRVDALRLRALAAGASIVAGLWAAARTLIPA